MKYILSILMFIYVSTSFSQLDIETAGASVDFNYFSEKTKGTLTGVKATIALNPSDLRASKVTGSVDVSTLSTKNKMRDKHLKSDDFFNVEVYPVMTFESSSISKNTEGYVAEGSLTIKETTNEVVFTVIEADSHLYFTTIIYAADFGIAIKKDREKSKIEITVSVPLG